MIAVARRMWAEPVRRWVAILLAFCVVASCGVLTPAARQGADDPIIYNRAAMETSDKIAIFVPGALSSAQVFAGSVIWEEAGYARAFYRYPGMDGLPIDHHVDPPTMARRVAALANAYPGRDVVLVGYSTGALVALEAVPQITKARSLKVVAMSPAVEFGGGLPTALRGARDILRAVMTAGSLRQEDVWKSFWAGLLFGPQALQEPRMEDEVATKVAEGEQIIVDLDLRIALAHMLPLPLWQLPQDLDVGDVPIAFFVGLNDPVMATWQVQDFAGKVGDVTIYGYADQGHLLFFTRPRVFADMLDFAEGRVPGK